MDIFESWLVKCPIAHRGVYDDQTPENSLGAFAKAIELGYAIDLDVRPLADGTIIVFHDDTLGRMTNADGYVATLDCNSIKELKLSKSEEHIPTLAEVLEFVDGRTPILIELKGNSGSGSYEKSVLDLLNAYKGEFAVQSFDPETLEYFKVNAPHFLRGQLAGGSSCKSVGFFRRLALKRMSFNKLSCPHFISYHCQDLPDPHVAKYRKQNIPVLAWTVRSNEEYERVKPFADNIVFEKIVPDTKD